jgi:RNA polymerase sigma factor (sigma-70 family)
MKVDVKSKEGFGPPLMTNADVERYRWIVDTRVSYIMNSRPIPSFMDEDDLIGVGMEGLVKAYRNYDPSKHSDIIGHLKFRVLNAIRDELRIFVGRKLQKVVGNSVSLHMVGDIIDDNADNLCEKIDRKLRSLRLWKEINKLPEMEKHMMIMSYKDELTQEQIGEVFGLSNSRVNQILQKTTIQLREIFEVADN